MKAVVMVFCAVFSEGGERGICSSKSSGFGFGLRVKRCKLFLGEGKGPP